MHKKLVVIAASAFLAITPITTMPLHQLRPSAPV